MDSGVRRSIGNDVPGTDGGETREATSSSHLHLLVQQEDRYNNAGTAIRYDGVDQAISHLIEETEIIKLEREVFTGEYSKLIHTTPWSNARRWGENKYKTHRILINPYLRIGAMLLALSAVIVSIFSIISAVKRIINEIENIKEDDVVTKVTKVGDILLRNIKDGQSNIANSLISYLVMPFFLIELILRVFVLGKTFLKHRFHIYGGGAVVIVLVFTLIARYYVPIANIFLFFIIFLHSVSNFCHALRHKASRTRHRYMRDRYDLDLTYITPNVIAMSFPSSGISEIQNFPFKRVDGDLALRNPIGEVVRFFKEKYDEGDYHIYNLCAERAYNAMLFNNQVYRCQVIDHSVPKLRELLDFCHQVEEFLNKNEKNIVAVHCKAGKGRTRTFISSWLIYSGRFKTVTEALEYFNHRRINLPKGNKFPVVVIPSQRRYVSYVEAIVKQMGRQMPPRGASWEVPFRRVTVQSADIAGLQKTIYEELRMQIVLDGEVKYETTSGHMTSNGTYRVTFTEHVEIAGDVLFRFKSPTLGRDWEDCAFYFWLHTSFIEENRFEADRHEIGNAYKWKHNDKYDENFNVNVTFVDSV